MANSQNGAVGMPNLHLREFFVDELRDILGLERQLLKGLKKLATALIETLRTAFETYYSQTEGQIERSKQVFTSIGPAERIRNARQWKVCLRKPMKLQKVPGSARSVRCRLDLCCAKS